MRQKKKDVDVELVSALSQSVSYRLPDVSLSEFSLLGVMRRWG